MRKIRYAVATSLDGYIAGPNGEADWIVIDPEVDFAAIWAQFDTLLMGRRTYEAATKRLGEAAFRGITSIVFSRTMKQRDHTGVTVVSELTAHWVQALQTRSGKDIWLMGGSELFRSLGNEHHRMGRGGDSGRRAQARHRRGERYTRVVGRRRSAAPSSLQSIQIEVAEPPGLPFGKVVIGI